MICHDTTIFDSEATEVLIFDGWDVAQIQVRVPQKIQYLGQIHLLRVSAHAATTPEQILVDPSGQISCIHPPNHHQ